MKNLLGSRILPWLVRAAILVGVLVAITIRSDGGSSTPATDDAVIERYDAVMNIDRYGVLELDETLDVRLPAGKHGIFRIFDVKDPRRSNVTHPVTVESVQRDGEDELYLPVEGPRSTDTIRIGHPNVILEPGVHRYVIRSRTVDVFEPGDGDTTLWWWDIIGSWQMPMESARVVANLPASPTRTECVRGTDTPCRVDVTDRRMTMEATSLAPYEPVTVRLTFPAAALAAPIPGPNTPLLIGMGVVGGLVVAGASILVLGRTRERTPGLPVLFEPPEGIYPALGAKIINEVESPYALQATLFDLAERGLLTLRGGPEGWDIEVVGDPSQTVMTAAEANLLSKLRLNRTGSTFLLRKTVDAGRTISAAQTDLNSQVRVDSKPYLDASPIGCLGTALGWLTVAALVLQIVWAVNGTGPIWPLFIPTAVAALIFAELMFNRAAWTVHNAAGRDMWSRVGGFGRFLTTDSSESRFNFAERMDLYPRYLPWALVLGSADAWAQRYREQGVEPPVVPWLIWTGPSRGYSMTSMTSSFDSAISSAAATYAASQASSGGGGGGFSGGSGGGGGGGGSW